ncbi:hypothetical protein VIGAN_10034800 [Vigna angularis var. angularis]|uniref:Uncharacterized protein n=1 Tax=Vigna angularis var. angularis TaxID=157739 RepID=A0A0S3T290_PHAAN|nr:hypothetical protein VIGAN_10034800 [Vigna angularis var. angularis]
MCHLSILYPPMAHAFPPSCQIPTLSCGMLVFSPLLFSFWTGVLLLWNSHGNIRKTQWKELHILDYIYRTLGQRFIITMTTAAEKFHQRIPSRGRSRNFNLLFCFSNP